MVAASLAGASSAAANTIQVTSNLDDGTDCTLREAIANANNNNGAAAGCDPGSGDDVITFQAGLASPINLGSTLITGSPASGQLLIDGPGAGSLTVSGQNATRILQVPISANSPANSITITDLTLSGGFANVSGAGGAAIYNSGFLTLDRTVVANNMATVTLAGNAATLGGAIYNESNLTVVESTVADNAAAANSTGGNFADALGGGIFSSGALDVRRSTIEGNTATATAPPPVGPNFDRSGGGGVFTNGATTTIRDSTIVGNTAANLNAPGGNFGGGVYTDSAAGTATLTSNTITGNMLVRNAVPDTQNRGANVSGGQTIPDLTNTIIGEPSGGVNCELVNSLGHNYTDDNASCDPEPTLGDIQGSIATALFGLLDNGGPTQTRMPRPFDGGVTVIDKGVAASLDVDQRDMQRNWPFAIPDGISGGDGTDIGAVEVQGVALTGTTPASPSTSADPGILGTSDNGTVQLYSDAACTMGIGPFIGNTPPNDFQINISGLDPNTSTTFRGKLQYGSDLLAVSACSPTSVTYQRLPTAPVLTTTVPASGSNNNAPLIKGTSLNPTTVTIYTSAACTGTPAGSGSDAVLSGAGIPVSVPDNSTTTFYASATGPGGLSPCSGPLSYAEVTPPATVPAPAKKKCKKGRKLKKGKCVKKKKKKK